MGLREGCVGGIAVEGTPHVGRTAVSHSQALMRAHAEQMDCHGDLRD